MSFELPLSDLDYEVTILSTNSLKLHESVVEDHVDELLEAIKHDGWIRDPVVVDRETKVVLDGMHRVTASRRLGLRSIPVCLIDYRAPAVKVGGWLRVFDTVGVEPLRSAFDARGLSFTPIERASRDWPSLPLLHGPETSVELGTDGESPKRVLDRTMAAVDALTADGFDSRLQRDSTLDRSGTQVTLVLPTPDKPAVVEAARTGDRFPPNTTRHVIPARPMAVNAPLDLLEGDPDDGARHFVRGLRERSIDRLPPGSDYSGRTYEEPLLVFD